MWSCRYCGHEVNDAEHTLFGCTKYEQERETLSTLVNWETNNTHIVYQMLESQSIRISGKL